MMENSPPQSHMIENSPPQFLSMNSPPQIRFLLNNSSGGPGPQLQVVHAMPYFPPLFIDRQPFSSHLMGEPVAGPSLTPAIDSEEPCLKNSPVSSQIIRNTSSRARMSTASSRARRSTASSRSRNSSLRGKSQGSKASRKYVPSIGNSGYESRSEEPSICIGSVFSLANMDDVDQALCPDPPVVTAFDAQPDNTVNPSKLRDILNGPPKYSIIDSDAAASSLLAATSPRPESPSSMSAVTLNYEKVSNASSTEPFVGIEVSEAATNTVKVIMENHRQHSPSLAESSIDSQGSKQEPVTQAAEKGPEVVDLEKEDIDDCMLVKIDLSKLYFPYGSKIHNTEVVIEDSDHEEEMTNPSGSSNLLKNALQDDAARMVPEATETSVVAGDTPAAPASHCSSPLAMEVDEIENEAELDNFSGNKSDNEDVPSNTEDALSDIEDFSRTDLQYSDDGNQTVSISVIRVSEKKDQSEAVLNELLPNASNERYTSTLEPERNTFDQFIPTTIFDVVGVQQSSDPSVPVISMVQSCSTDVSLELPELHLSHDQPCQPALYKSSVSSETSLPSSNIVLKVPMFVKSVHCASEELVAEKDKAGQNESVSIVKEPRVVTNNTVMCKLCYCEFPTRVDLVTHTWNCHRIQDKGSNLSNHQCENCAKTFTSDSLMRLHQKVMCPNKGMLNVRNKVSVNLVDQILSSLSFPEAISKVLATANTSQVLQQKQQLSKDNKPGQSQGCSSDPLVASNPLKAHVKLEPGVISVDDCSNSIDSFLEDTDLGTEHSSSLPYTAGGNKNQVQFLPSNSSSTCERGVTPKLDIVKSEIISIPDDQSDAECSQNTLREECLECMPCNLKFVNSSDLVRHQRMCPLQEVLSGITLKCFVCYRGFTSAHSRYQHMWMNTKCKEGVKLFCSKCETAFWYGEDKQTHLAVSKDCWKYEMDLMETVLKDARSGKSEIMVCAGADLEQSCSRQKQTDNNSFSNGSTQIDNLPSIASADSSSVQDEARDGSSGWEVEVSTHKLAVTLRKETPLPTVTPLTPVTSTNETPLLLVTSSMENPLSPVTCSSENHALPVTSNKETPLLPATPSRETLLPHVTVALPIAASTDTCLPSIIDSNLMAVPKSSYGNFNCRKCQKNFISSAGLLKHLYTSLECHTTYNSCEAGIQDSSDRTKLTFKQHKETPALTSENLPTPVQTQTSCKQNKSLQDDSSSSETESSSSPPIPCKRKTSPDVDVRCPGCRNKFPSKAVLMLHLNSSFKCRRKVIQTSKVAKRTPLVLNNSPQQRNNFKEMVKQVAEDSTNASKTVATQQTHTSGTHSSPDKQCSESLMKQKHITHSQPVEPELNPKSSFKVSALDNIVKATQKSLRVVIKPVSVMCSTCHSAFKDDARLAMHLHMNQNCLKKSKDQNQPQLSKTVVEAGRRDGKKKTCEIVTGINDSTSFVSIVSSREGCLSLQEQPQLVSEAGQKSLFLDLSPTTQADHSNSSLSRSRKMLSADNDNNHESYGRQDDHKALSDVSSDGSDKSSDSDDSKDEMSEEYVCKPCNESFSGKPSFDKHRREHHQFEHTRKVHCKVCTRKFSDLTCLQAHLLQFRYCFTPLVRKLLHKEQGQHVCCMCQKMFDSSKLLRRHCFKKMTCRLRFVNALLKSKPDKVKISDASMDDSYRAQAANITVNAESEILIQNDEAIVLSPGNSLRPNDSISPLGTKKSKNLGLSDERNPYLEPDEQPQQQCHKCKEFFSDLADHLLKKSDCFDMYKNDLSIRPISLCLCFTCKMSFTNLDFLNKHNCSPPTVYVHVCTCNLKFRSQQELKIHIYNSPACAKAVSEQAKMSKNDNLKRQANDKSKPNNCKHQNEIEQLDKLVADMVPIVKNKVPAVNEDCISTINNVTIAVEDNDCLIIETSAAVEEQPTPPLYSCLICDEQFITLNLLMKHSHEHAEETPVTCYRCKITFLRYNQFVSHQAFHIRMDKEAVSSPEKQHSPRASHSYQSSSQQVGFVGSTTCLFCHRQFPSNKAKVEHVNNSESCMGVIKYIVENKYFAVPSQNTVPLVNAAPNSQCCEFCHLPFVDKLSHYLESSCLTKLEQAVAQYRAAIQGGSPPAYTPDPPKKETVGLLSKLMCDTGTRSELQSRQHSEQAASSKPVEEGNKFFCFSSMKSLKTEEISTHSASCRHCYLLPTELLDLGCWENSDLRCKLCNTRYKLRYSLIRHIKAKHRNAATTTITTPATPVHAVLSKKYTCNMCSQVVMHEDLENHFKQHLTELIRFVRTSTSGSLKQPSTEYCILCNRVLSSRYGLMLHFKRHQFIDMFKSEVLSQVQATAEKEDTSNLSPHHSIRGKVSPVIPQSGSCKLCQQEYEHFSIFKAHFMFVHDKFETENCAEYFIPLNQLKDPPAVTTKNSTKRSHTKNQQFYECKICGKIKGGTSFWAHFRGSHSGNCEEWPPFRVVELNPTSAEHDDVQDQNRNCVVSAGDVSMNGAVSCKICNRVCLSISGFRSHFKQRHGGIYPKNNVDDYFIVHKSFAIKSKKTKFRLKQNQFLASNLEPRKLEDSNMTSTSSTTSSVLEHDTPSGLPQKKKTFHRRKLGAISFPFQKKAKPARTDAIGSCRLCHKYFTHMIAFKLHFRNSHRTYDPGNFQRFFNYANKTECPSEAGNDLAGSLLQSSAHWLQSPLKHVCCMCRASFIDSESYHAHLKSHLKKCQVLVDDISLFAEFAFPPSIPMSQIPQTYTKQDAELQATHLEPNDTYSSNFNSLARSRLPVREEESFPPDSTTSEDVASSSQHFARLRGSDDIFTEQVVHSLESGNGNLTSYPACVVNPQPGHLSINVSSVSSTAHSPLDNQLLFQEVAVTFEGRLKKEVGGKNISAFHVPELLSVTNSYLEEKTKSPLENIISEVLSVSDSFPDSDSRFQIGGETKEKPLESIISTLQRKRSHSEGGVNQTEEQSTSKKVRLLEQDLINTSL